MLTTSSSDEEGGSMTKDDDCDQIEDENPSSGDDERQSDITAPIPNASFSITKEKKDNNGSSSSSSNVQSMMNPFASSSKLSLLQTFNLQQQQQLFQQAAISAIAPQFSQQLNNSPINLSETEAKFREFAFKTMQELLNIYGLSMQPNEILDAMKNQQMSELKKYFIKFVPKLHNTK